MRLNAEPRSDPIGEDELHPLLQVMHIHVKRVGKGTWVLLHNSIDLRRQFMMSNPFMSCLW